MTLWRGSTRLFVAARAHVEGRTTRRLCGGLSRELAQRELTEPRGVLSVAVAATIARRAFYDARRAFDETRHWFSEGSTA
jgi:hypothetical protein